MSLRGALCKNMRIIVRRGGYDAATLDPTCPENKSKECRMKERMT